MGVIKFITGWFSKFILLAAGLLCVFYSLQSVVMAQGITNEDIGALRNGRPWYEADAADRCTTVGGGSGGGGGGSLSNNVPDPWRSLIMSTAPNYTDADPRLVAAVLFVENRGWPEFKTSGWGVSSAGAAGPWQFIDSTWASMGHDGDGDGRKDRDNPYDAVHAAFKHHAGSAGKPIAAEFDGDADSSFEKVIFQRDRENLLSFAASYNGSGAPSGTALKDFPRNENSDYVIMSYWLLATDFAKGYNISSSGGSFIDATKTGGLFGAVVDTSGDTSTIGTSCGGATGSTVEGFPLQTTQAALKEGVDGSHWCFDNQDNCHHHYNAADIFIPTGTPVVAAKAGRVVMARDVGEYPSSTGSRVVIMGKDDHVYYYTHMGEGTIRVQEGQQVTAGQEVGRVGTKENAMGTTPHLHFDIQPPPATNRPSCSSASCQAYEFLNVQPILIPAFNKLPES